MEKIVNMNKRLVQNIERNKLDYLLTDLLPIEISGLLDFYSFYDYLLNHRKEMSLLCNKINDVISRGKDVPFADALPSAPLKYFILKGQDGKRTLSLIQPAAMINVCLFIYVYQKQLLLLLRENAYYSLRYHRKNTRLYHQVRMGQYDYYFQKSSKIVPYVSIGGVGEFFDIFPFKSIVAFSSSAEWSRLKNTYKYYMRVDYKSCFPSIYTHSYKWTRAKDTIDSKGAHNPNLFLAIDALLQKINGRSSNGVIVGPEFSRMIVEILLQHIDKKVMNRLIRKGLKNGAHYEIKRYVDDIFVFAMEESVVDTIKTFIEEEAAEFLLYLNESKIEMLRTSQLSKPWLSKIRRLNDEILDCFTKLKEISGSLEEEKCILRTNRYEVYRIIDNFEVLIGEVGEKSRSAVSYLLATIHKKISVRARGVKLIREGRFASAFAMIELVFHLWSQSPCYEHTQRLVSILNYFNDDLMFSEDIDKGMRLAKIFRRFENVILKTELADCMNMVISMPTFKVSLSANVEDALFEKIKQSKNPVYLADLIMYSQHSKEFHSAVVKYANMIIEDTMPELFHEEAMMMPEFWYLLVFKNCPYLTIKNKQLIDDVCIHNFNENAQNVKNRNIQTMTSELVYGFLKTDGIYNWSTTLSAHTSHVTYKTWQRCMYRAKHVRAISGIDVSIV